MRAEGRCVMTAPGPLADGRHQVVPMDSSAGVTVREWRGVRGHDSAGRKLGKANGCEDCDACGRRERWPQAILKSNHGRDAGLTFEGSGLVSAFPREILQLAAKV